MHVQRFKQYLAASAVVSWIAFGLYPFGTPSVLYPAPDTLHAWVVAQLLALLIIVSVGAIGLWVSMETAIEFLFADDEEFDDLIQRRQAVLLRAAPFALFSTAGTAVMGVSFYVNGAISTRMFSLGFFSNLFLMLLVIAATRAVLYHEPEHVRE